MILMLHAYKPIIYIGFCVCRNQKEEIQAYCKWIEGRLFTCIASWDSEQERAEQEMDERNQGRYFSDDYDPSDEYDEIISQCLQAAEVNGYMTGVSISGLYHLWEKQVMDHLLNEINKDWSLHEEYKLKPDKYYLRNWDDILNLFKSYSTDLTTMPFCEGLNELRLIANSIKHGNGGSYRILRQMGHDILEPYGTESDLPLYSGSHSLMCVELYPRKKHFAKFKEAVFAFWDFDFWHSIGEHRPFERWYIKFKKIKKKTCENL